MRADMPGGNTIIDCPCCNARVIIPEEKGVEPLQIDVIGPNNNPEPVKKPNILALSIIAVGSFLFFFCLSLFQRYVGG